MNARQPNRAGGRLHRAWVRVAETRAGGWLAINVANRVDRVLLPLTNGRLHVSFREPVGRLTTVGARSGKVRHTPLLYVTDDDNVILTASKAGSDRHPAWFHNLKAKPEVKFLKAGGERAYVAREARGSERERLWERVNELYPGYDTYQGRTSREIPIVVLEPRD